MKFLIITHVQHTLMDGKIYGYGPYIKEMNLWLKYVDEVKVVAPLNLGKPDPIDLAYEHHNIHMLKVPAFHLIGVFAKVRTMFLLPYIFMKICLGMYWADHIHIRCPGNMGLLGAIAQLFFPWKIKTVKYAGNWDPMSPQPLTYRLQKSILSNPVISKHTQVLVYGSWPKQTKNVLEFFTATYKENDKTPVTPRVLNSKINISFVGALSPGKRPLIAIKAVEELRKRNVDAYLDLMGEGVERVSLENYITTNSLDNYITLHGNQNADFVKEKYKKSHFLILMSQSEGWPKVLAEAMFWGCVPISTRVSCVNYMMGESTRGALVQPDAIKVADAIEAYIKDDKKYQETSQNALSWSRQFTLESFENAIKGVLGV